MSASSTFSIKMELFLTFLLPQHWDQLVNKNLCKLINRHFWLNWGDVCKISWSVLQRAVTVPGTDSCLVELCVAAQSFGVVLGKRSHYLLSLRILRINPFSSCLFKKLSKHPFLVADTGH